MTAKHTANFTPVNTANNNAIDSTCFAIGFERVFDMKESANFKNLENSLKNELPSFSTLAKVSVTIQQSGNDEPKFYSQENLANAPQGVVLQKFGADGIVDWILQVTDNKIIINCNDYVNWDNTWQKAKCFLLEVLKLLDLQTNKITFVALQVIDKFIYADSENYKLEDIFQIDSSYLTPRAKSCGNLWHVHQGWFEPMHNTKCLNVLNIGSVEVNEGLFTITDHNQQVVFDKLPLPLENLLKKEDDKGIIEAIYKDLHVNNKKVVEGLFNKTTLELIKFYGK